MQNTKNLLIEISETLSLQQILERINWFNQKVQELNQQYKQYITVNEHNVNLMYLNSIQMHATYREIDGIVSITNPYGDNFQIEGVYHTTSQTYTYNVPVGSRDEGWATRSGYFTESENMRLPKYIFDSNKDEVEKKLEEEYKKDFEQRYINELIYWEKN